MAGPFPPFNRGTQGSAWGKIADGSDVDDGGRRDVHLRRSTANAGRSPLAFPVIGGFGNFASPGSITK
jgi:hypothetical protein